MNAKHFCLHCVLLTMLFCVCAMSISFAQTDESSPPLPQIDISSDDALGFLGVDPDELYKAARDAQGNEDFEVAAKFYIAMLNMDSSNQNALYNLSCCFAMLDDAPRASECLLAAAEAGFASLWELEHDPEFNPIRESEEFISAVESIQAELEEEERKQGERLFFKTTTYNHCYVQFPDDYDPRKQYKLLVGLHGYGSNPARFVSLWDRFATHDFIFAVPQAPYAFNSGLDDPGYSWGLWTDTYGLPANSWSLATDYVAQTIDQLQNMYPVSETYVLGFSQGAAMSYFVGIEHPHLLSGIIPFGGWLDVDGIGDSVIADANNNLRVFIAHGNEDNVIEYQSGIDALDKLTDWGFDVMLFEFNGGHRVPEEALQTAEKWMKNPPDDDAAK